MTQIVSQSRRCYFKALLKSPVKRIRAGLGLAISLLFLCGAQPGRCEDEVQNILVLHSYHHGYKWTDDITQGLREALSRGNLPVALHVEYMDTKRVAAADYESDLATFYRKKFRGVTFRLIVCSDNNAITFMAHWGQEIFPGTPVVFCGFNFLRKQDMPLIKGFTGINEESDIAGGLDLILKLHPGTRTLYIINDQTPTGMRVMDQLRYIIPRYNGRLEFIFLDNLAMPDLLATVKTLKQGDVIFYAFFFRDKTGRFFEYDESIQMIARDCPVPIYGAWDFSLGHGIIGGLLTSGFYQGEAAGNLALRILNGESVSQIPVVTKSPNRYMFDYHQLAAFKIKPSKLPPGSIIINQPPSLYQQYQHAVWAGLAALFVQLIIIFFLASSILRRRRVEKAIHQNQKRLNMILETANEGFWEIDAFGIGVNVNAELCMILNRSRSEIVGHSILAFADAHNRSIFEEQLAKRRQGERSQYEIALQRPDGSAVHCQFNSSPLFSDSGLFTGAFSMVTDISKRKRDEDILKNREAMLQAIFESTDNAIAVIDDNGSLSKVNKRFKELFPPSGLTNDLSENQISLRKWMKPYIPQNEWPACLQYPMRAMGEEMVGRIRCCNGRVIDVSCFPLQWTTATFGGTVFSFRDITEKIRLESQLLQSQKMEALGTLTSGIAHDFNNILAAILGYTEILQYQFKHTPDALKKISRVLKAAHRAKDLVQQIHSFSRPQQIAPRPLCAGLMVKEVVKLLQASLPPDIKVQIDQRSKRDSVTVDPGQIHQVIMNLCTNAVHAMQEDGGLLTVVLDTVSFEYPKQLFDTILPGGEYLLLQVKDTGCGIPREIVQKIFDPYFTTKEKGQGTGLGLAVTLGIIKNHGGAIRVDSHEWQGSVFSVYLPLSKEAPSMEDAPLQPLPMGAGRIFLVDDEPEITAMMNEMLLHLGYQTTAFTDSQQALAAFNDHPEAYDIAIVDMIMPGISGPEIAEAIRDKRKDMPIFLCTGYSDPPVMDTAPMRLFNRCLTKPLELQELAEVLHKTLSSNNIAP